MTFDLASRFKNAFGFVALKADEKSNILKTTNANGLSVFELDDDSVFDEVTFYDKVEGDNFAFSWKSVSENDEQLTSVLASPPMFQFRRSKKLIVTPIDNSDTEVVERYATRSWLLTMKGLLIDMEEHNFPLDKLEKLNELFEKNKIWNVASEICQALKIESVYFDDIDIRFIEGYEDTIAYTIMAHSIKPLEYQLLKN